MPLGNRNELRGGDVRLEVNKFANKLTLGENVFFRRRLNIEVVGRGLIKGAATFFFFVVFLSSLPSLFWH